MKVFLTGATGYLGGRIAAALLAAGHEVRALVRRPEAVAELAASGLDPVEGGLEDLDAWVGSLRGCQGLIHAAALVETWGVASSRFDLINVTATLDLLGRARELGVERRIDTGSLFALAPSHDGTPGDESLVDAPMTELQRANDYIRTKTLLRTRLRDLQRSGDSVIQVFPTVLMGPGARTKGNHTAKVLSDVLAGKAPGLVGDGKQRWNLVGVDDAARGHVLALEKGAPGENYILGGEDWTQQDLVLRAATAFGVKPPLRRLGIRLPLAVAAASGAWSRLTGKPPLLTRGEVLLYDRHWAFDSGKARRDLDYSPRPVAEVLADTVAWLRETGGRRGMTTLDGTGFWLNLGMGAAVNAILAAAAWRAGSVRVSGALAGFILGTVIFACLGWRGFSILAGFFVLGSGLTRFGYARKEAMGAAEAKGGARGASHAVANAGVATVLAVAAWWSGETLLVVGFVAAFATAAMDTAGSELGPLYGRRTISLRNLKPVPPGTEGAVSLEGTLGGLVAALALALLAWATGLLGEIAIPAIVAGSFLGNLYEGILGSRRLLPHGWLNATNTLVGAVAAVIVRLLVS